MRIQIQVRIKLYLDPDPDPGSRGKKTNQINFQVHFQQICHKYYRKNLEKLMTEKRNRIHPWYGSVPEKNTGIAYQAGYRIPASPFPMKYPEHAPGP